MRSWLIVKNMMDVFSALVYEAIALGVWALWETLPEQSTRQYENLLCKDKILIPLSMEIIEIKYEVPYCVTCPSMSMDPGSLNEA